MQSTREQQIASIDAQIASIDAQIASAWRLLENPNPTPTNQLEFSVLLASITAQTASINTDSINAQTDSINTDSINAQTDSINAQTDSINASLQETRRRNAEAAEGENEIFVNSVMRFFSVSSSFVNLIPSLSRP
jgi:hypothetical protein